MKASIERLALKLAMIGLAVVAMAAPARARLSVRNGESASKALITTRPWWASGTEMTVVGVIEAAITYGVGLAFAHGRPLP